MNTIALLLNGPLFLLYLIFIALGFWLGYHLWGGDARRLERIRENNNDLRLDVAARQANADAKAKAKADAKAKANANADKS